jgi:putative heme-binding domain-containing protein
LNALVALDGRRHAPTVARVLKDASAPVELREHAAGLLAKTNVEETQSMLLAALATAPARLQNSIAAHLAGGRTGAERLLDAVAAGKASARLLQERGVAARLAEAKIPNLKTRLDKLTAGLPAADERMETMLKGRRDAFRAAKTDVVVGRAVFEKRCAVCHQLDGLGAKIGPQLEGVGVRGVERLLEDTLDPNRNVDQAFRLTTLNLKDGRVVDGLLLKEEGAVLVLADKEGKEVRVPKDAVDERSTSQLSPMPANFADQIPEPEFYNLIAYLLTRQTVKDPQSGK